MILNALLGDFKNLDTRRDQFYARDGGGRKAKRHVREAIAPDILVRSLGPPIGFVKPIAHKLLTYDDDRDSHE
jgi:hypothetical protein